MSLRRRIVLLATAAVAVAVVLAVLTCYVVVRKDLRSGVDAALRDLRPQVSFVRAPPPGELTSEPQEVQIELPEAPLGGATGIAQAVAPSGDVIARRGAPRLPTDRRTREVAAAPANRSSATPRSTASTSASSPPAGSPETRSCWRGR